MKTFVINLTKYIDNFNIQKPYLENIGLNPIRFSGINAMENEHLNYKNYINKNLLPFLPPSVIGGSLSHILLAKHISDLSENYCLVMEDDAFPLYDKKEFHKRLDKTIKDITILDKDWDIIQLHCDGITSNFETYNSHMEGVCGSAAANLISKKGAYKMSQEKVKTYIDIQTTYDYKFNKYKIKENLFWTDEKKSNSRNNNINLLLKIKEKILINTLGTLRGEKTWIHLLNYKLIKIPHYNKELTGDQIINYIIFLIIAFNSVKFLNKNLLK